MGGWKDELRKIRPVFGRKHDATPNKHPSKSEPENPGKNNTSWKQGVNPLAHNTDRVPSKGSRWRNPGDQRKSSNHQQQTRTGKKAKPKSIPVNDGLPSMAAIQQAYGSRKSAPKQQHPSAGEVEIQLPGFADLPRVTLTQASEFKEPDAWVSNGIALQAPGGGTGQILRVRLGIDFGTAYTKVALKVADKVLFVDWGGVLNGDGKYLLPGEVSRRADERTCLGRPADAVETYGGLKLPFLSHSIAGIGARLTSVMFLAWVIRYARAWLYRHQLPLTRSRRLVWEVNIGCPTNPWSVLEIRDHYRWLVQSAWKLSQVHGKITMQAAEALINSEAGNSDAMGLDDLQVVPEFVAQVLSYVKSTQRQPGLHLLVDVGAGTMDIANFNVHREESEYGYKDNLPIFACDVLPLGTHILTAARLALSDRSAMWVDSGGIPSVKQLSHDFAIEPRQLFDLDDRFSDRIRGKVYRILSYTKMRRDPDADAWKEGMRVFLAGGGSGCDVYRKGIERAFADLGVKPLFTPFVVSEGVQDIGEQGFHRVSVAYGLTYDTTSIGKIERPQEIEDVPRRNNRTREQLDRDELYPK